MGSCSFKFSVQRLADCLGASGILGGGPAAEGARTHVARVLVRSEGNPITIMSRDVENQGYREEAYANRLVYQEQATSLE